MSPCTLMSLPPLWWEWLAEASLLVLREEWEAQKESAQLWCPRQIPINLQRHEGADNQQSPTAETRTDHHTQSAISHWLCVVVCYTAKPSWYTALKPQLWRESIFDKNGVFVFAIKYFALRNRLGLLVKWWIQMPLASYSQSILCAQMVKKSAYPACTLFEFYSPLP